MIITTIDAPKSGRRGYVIDPHDGRCNGQHNVAVTQFRNSPGTASKPWGRACYTVGPVAILSRLGTVEIREALEKALELGLELDLRDDVEQHG